MNIQQGKQGLWYVTEDDKIVKVFITKEGAMEYLKGKDK